MWLKFKNVATPIIETFYLLTITILLGNPFNVKQIDNIFVMASMENSIFTSIMLNDVKGAATNKTSNATVITTAFPSRPTTTTTSTSLAKSWFNLEKNDFTADNRIFNSTFKKTIHKNVASNDIETLNDDSENYERGLSSSYFMTKQSSSFSKSIQQPATTMITTGTVTTTAAAGTMTTKLLTPTKFNTTKILTSTTGKLLSFSTSSLSPLSSTLSSTLPDNEELNGAPTRLLLNKTQIDVLASYSLLSSTLINDSTEPLTKKLKSLSSTTYTFVSATPASTVSVATSTLTFPNHEMSVTALRHKGNKQNMHNTNSHLTVDNVNTIVSTKKATTTTTTISTSKRQEQEQQEQQELEQMDEQQKHKKGTTTKLSSQNAHTTSKGSSNGISVGSSSTSSTSNSSGGERNKTNISMEELIAATGNSNRTNTSTTRISARKVDNKSILSKTHKTDAPMLNYIFDTFSSANKHHHHDQRYGPHFEDVQLVGQPTNMTVQAGSSIHLNCRISLLQDKTVSWVRRNSQGENALDLLTVGLHTYTGDKRYKMEFQYPSNWRLKINNVKKDDEATYECQISTHPPRVIQINLHVNAPKVMIVDEFGDPLQEKYYEQDSTLQLSCVVRNVAMSASVVFWKHIEDILNYDVTRGGVSVKTELMDDGANSTLFIAKINKADSGNYTCSISEYQNYTIVVHILNGESFAELHHGGAFSWQQFNYQVWLINLILATTLLLLLPAYVHR